MAVLASCRRGVGRTLIATRIELAREQSRRTIRVGTAAADLENLRFYMQLGFRMRSIELNVFTPATGYDQPACVDGIKLRDRVWLDLPSTTSPARRFRRSTAWRPPATSGADRYPRPRGYSRPRELGLSLSGE